MVVLNVQNGLVCWWLGVVLILSWGDGVPNFWTPSQLWVVARARPGINLLRHPRVWKAAQTAVKGEESSAGDGAGH